MWFDLTKGFSLPFLFEDNDVDEREKEKRGGEGKSYQIDHIDLENNVLSYAQVFFVHSIVNCPSPLTIQTQRIRLQAISSVSILLEHITKYD